MPVDQTSLPSDPITFVYSAGKYLSEGKKPKAAPYYNRELLNLRIRNPEAANEIEEATADKISDIDPNKYRNPVAVSIKTNLILQAAADRAKRTGSAEQEFEEEPERDDDYADPGAVYDQPLSPVFGGAGAIRSGSAISKEMAARAKKAAEFERIFGKVGYEMTAIDKARRLFSIASKDIPNAAKLRKLGAKYLRKVKPSAIGRFGGLSGIAVSVGGQYAIEKASEILARRQFSEMERILKRQQTETDRVVKAARSRKAPTTASAPIKAPPKTPLSASKPRTPGPAIARQPTPATAAKIDPPRPLAAVKTSSPTPLPKAKVSTLGQKITRLLSKANSYAPFLDLLRNEPKAISSRSTFIDAGLRPALQPRTSTLTSSGRLGLNSSEKLCPCPKPRTKSTKKRKKPRICVTPAAARRAGIIN